MSERTTVLDGQGKASALSALPVELSTKRRQLLYLLLGEAQQLQ